MSQLVINGLVESKELGRKAMATILVITTTASAYAEYHCENGCKLWWFSILTTSLRNSDGVAETDRWSAVASVRGKGSLLT